MVNVNIGVTGHVDSGKTSLCKALSTTASTAAFDSNPQSKERGITLDLGFSSFSTQGWNFTLVDCPGHSSLIRTVIGGSQIMDVMILVIDINKGMEPQAAECLILAQIVSSHLIVVLNKVDTIPQQDRETKINKVTKLMKGALGKTKFSNEPIVPASAIDPSIGTERLKESLIEKAESVNYKERRTHLLNRPFLMAVDHCFSIRGQGSIITGTVLQGCVHIADNIEFPSIKEIRKVKSMQSFRVPVSEAQVGDRVGLAVPGLDSSKIERTVVSAPGLIKSSVYAAIVSFEKIPYFKKDIKSKKRYHISIGYETTTAQIHLFRRLGKNAEFDSSLEYEHVEEFGIMPIHKEEKEVDKSEETIFILLEFDRPTMAGPNNLLIGSDLQETESVGVSCRLAFSGRVISISEDKNYKSSFLNGLKVFKEKMKEGSVDRVLNETELIVKGFCKRESNIDHLIGLTVFIQMRDQDSDGKELKGRIESRFGQTDKIRVSVIGASFSKEKSKEEVNKFGKVTLKYKKYIFTHSETKKLIQ